MKQTIFLKVFQLVLLLVISTHSWALTCKVSTGQILSSTNSAIFPVHISPVEAGSRVTMIDMRNEVTCNTESTLPESIYMTLGALATFQQIDSGVKAWVIINGVEYDINSINALNPVKILTITSADGNTPLPVQISYEISDRPGEVQVVHKGDPLVGWMMYISNNQIAVGPSWAWEIDAGNDSVLVTSSCTIDHGDALNVPFGTIDATDIKTTAAEDGVSMTEPLDFECTNASVSQNVRIEIIGNTDSFSGGQYLHTSNDALGIAMVHNGELVKPGEGFVSNMTNGVGDDSLKFVVVRNPAVDPKDTPTGDFNASATMVMVAD